MPRTEGSGFGDAIIHDGRNETASMSLMKYVLSNAMVSNINTSAAAASLLTRSR